MIREKGVIRWRRVVIVGVTQRADVAQFILRSAKRQFLPNIERQRIGGASLVFLNPFTKQVRPTKRRICRLPPLHIRRGCNIRREAVASRVDEFISGVVELLHTSFCCILTRGTE